MLVIWSGFSRFFSFRKDCELTVIADTLFVHMLYLCIYSFISTILNQFPWQIAENMLTFKEMFFYYFRVICVSWVGFRDSGTVQGWNVDGWVWSWIYTVSTGFYSSRHSVQHSRLYQSFLHHAHICKGSSAGNWLLPCTLKWALCIMVWHIQSCYDLSRNIDIACIWWILTSLSSGLSCSLLGNNSSFVMNLLELWSYDKWSIKLCNMTSRLHYVWNAW